MKIKLFLASLFMMAGLAFETHAQSGRICEETKDVELSCGTVKVCNDSVEFAHELEEFICERGWGPR